MSAFCNKIISHNKRVYNKLETSIFHINLTVNTPVLLVLSVLLPIFNTNRRKDSVKRSYFQKYILIVVLLGEYTSGNS